MPASQHPNHHAQGLKLVSFCPVCETRSKSLLARTLGTQGETKLMHITCHKCENAFLALVLVNQVGASSVGVVTDLAYEDVFRFSSGKNVSVDDVIAVHEYLKNTVTTVLPRQKAPKTRKTSVGRTRKNLQK